MTASGLLLDLALLFLGMTGLIKGVCRLVPRTVLIGLQVTLGRYLLVAGIGLVDGFWGLSFFAYPAFLRAHLACSRDRHPGLGGFSKAATHATALRYAECPLGSAWDDAYVQRGR